MKPRDSVGSRNTELLQNLFEFYVEMMTAQVSRQDFTNLGIHQIVPGNAHHVDSSTFPDIPVWKKDWSLLEWLHAP